MLAEGLKLIGRQTRTTGGPLDLLGVEPDGRLSVFELKRGTLSREAVAQVIDYASDLEDMDTESLYRHIADQSGNLGIQNIDDFEEWYRENYADDASLTPLRMVLVGLGVDEPTERMVNYLVRSGVDISLLTFHCFEQDGKTLFARQVEVDSSNTPVGPRHRVPRSQQFRESIHSVDVERLVDDVTQMFMRQTVSFSKTHSKSKLNFCLDYSWHRPEDGSWSPKKVRRHSSLRPTRAGSCSVSAPSLLPWRRRKRSTDSGPRVSNSKKNAKGNVFADRSGRLRVQGLVVLA